jgi:hypothetical protein
MKDGDLRRLAEQTLGAWGEQRRGPSRRGRRRIRGALWAGISKHRIYVLTGIARTTIDRISDATPVPTDDDRRLILKLIEQLGALQGPSHAEGAPQEP